MGNRRYTFAGLVLAVCLLGLHRTGVPDETTGRRRAALEWYYSHHAARPDLGQITGMSMTINWAFCALALDRPDREIDRANELLGQLLRPLVEGKFWSAQREEPPGTHQRYWGIYWEQISLAHMVLDQRIHARLTRANDRLIKELLWDYVQSRSIVDLDQEFASTAPDKVLRIYGSDNHDMHNRGIFFLSAQAFKNDAAFSQRPYKDGRMPADHCRRWTANLLEYFRQRARKGVIVELASPTYTGAYLRPIFIICDRAEDPRLRRQARKFLDLYFADVAQETIDGVRGGAKTRVYKHGPGYRASYDQLLCFNFILTGQPGPASAICPLRPEHGFTAPSLACAISSYRLPEAVLELMTHRQARGVYTYTSSRLAQGGIQRFTVVKPDDDGFYIPQVPSRFVRSSHVTPEYVLGWFTMDERESYMALHTQNQVMGLMTAATPDSRIVFEGDTASSDDSTYADLQAVGNRHAILLRRQITASRQGALRAYVSDDFSIEPGPNGWLFGRNGDESVYYAMKTVRQKLETPGDARGETVSGDDLFRIVPAGKHPGRFLKFLTGDVVIALEVSRAGQYAGFDGFKRDMLDNRLERTNGGEKFVYHAGRDAGTLTMYVDNRPPEIDGQSVAVVPKLTYDSPYLKAPYDSSTVHITTPSGKTLELDFDY